MTTRDKLLKQIGIIQWKLSNITILRGEHAMSIADNMQLVIISDEIIDLNHVFIKDVLRSMMIDQTKVVSFLTKDIRSMLPQEVNWPCWILSKQLLITSKKFILYSLPFSEICSNTNAKRALWVQICQYEDYLFG